MPETVVFIHGMFQNAKSWEHWTPIFAARGFDCIVESWPLHEGEPEELRRHPPTGLGSLRLQTVIDRYLDLIHDLPEKPLVIGHSVGGLIVQKLVELDLVRAAVAICPVAPNRMLAIDWGFFKNSIEITNPFLGDEPFQMTAGGFRHNFANCMTAGDSAVAYRAYATHDSRNVLRDCMLGTGQIDLSKGSAPLAIIAAENDAIIPPELCEKNAHAHQDAGRQCEFVKFPNRGHFICGEPDWEEVSAYVLDWISSTSKAQMAAEHPLEVADVISL